jgi:hypothetical protein
VYLGAAARDLERITEVEDAHSRTNLLTGQTAGPLSILTVPYFDKKNI